MRLAFYATALRNIVLSFLDKTPIGFVMPDPYNAAQIAAAREDFDFWTAKGAPLWVVAAFLADNCREDSFRDYLRGDRDKAGGKAQWHGARHDLIEEEMGIDVWNDPPEKQNEAIYAEITALWSPYRKIWKLLLATTNYHDANVILIQRYEQSGSQASDLEKQDRFAAYWIDYAQKNWIKAAA